MGRGVPTLLAIVLLAGAMGMWAWTMPRSGQAQQESTTAPVVVPRGRTGGMRVMAANIRLSEPQDGDNAWANRRELVVKTFLKYESDFVGCQEVSPAQGAYLDKELAPWYGYFPRAGIGRGPNASGTRASAGAEIMGAVGGAFASMNTLYYRSARFEAVDGEAGLVIPEEPQAVATENTFYALAVLKEKSEEGSGGDTFIVVDVHLRHGDDFAARCAARVREKIGVQLKKYVDAHVIVIGDMNHDRTSKTYAVLTAKRAAADGIPTLYDTFDYRRKGPNESWGNWHAFTGRSDAMWPTDLILVDRQLTFGAADSADTRGAELVRDQGEHGRWPSDHFFVQVDLPAWKSAQTKP